MCCSSAKRAKREARAAQARVTRDEAMLRSYRAQESAILRTHRVHQSLATQTQKAHEAAALKVQRAEEDLSKLKRELERQKEQQDQPSEQLSTDASAAPFQTSGAEDGLPAYDEVMQNSSPRPALPPVRAFGRSAHSDSSDDDDDKNSPPLGESPIDISSLPLDHPVHRMSSCKMRRLRRRGIDPVLKAEMDEMARLRGQSGFWSRLR